MLEENFELLIRSSIGEFLINVIMAADMFLFGQWR
jgi:hypothetical protein